MTEYAVPTVISTETAAAESEWMRPGYEVAHAIAWRCPACERRVATTLIHARGGQRLPSTVIVGMDDPVHIPEADDGAVRFFGFTSREMRSKGPRRPALQRWAESEKRFKQARARGDLVLPIIDHEPIGYGRFDSLCTECPRRLRFHVPLG